MSNGHAAPPGDVCLRARGLTKRFGPVTACGGVDLELRRGEILALLGENGAGKTSLMAMLFGQYVPDAGGIEVAAAGGLVSLPPGRPAAALAAGIGMVHQHFALAGNLSVLENIVLGTRPLWSLSQRMRTAAAAVTALMAQTGLSVPLHARVGTLSVGEQQRVELLRVLHRGTRILVLDEPTAVLTPQEALGLFATLRRLAAGGLSVVFISHKLHEVLDVAGRVVVLRAGRVVADQPVAGADRASLSALMVGRSIAPSKRTPQVPGAPMLVLDRVSVAAPAGQVGVQEASLVVRAGEVVGVAGVAGNGQGRMAALLAGTAAPSSGRMTLHGAAVRASPGAMVAAGVARIPEDRHREGVVPGMTVAENLALETLASPDVQRWGFLRFGRMRARARAAIAAFDVRCPGPDARVGLLSGGNMQKVVLARAFGQSPRLVVASQPTRGLDVGAASEVHRLLLDARARGAGVLLISEDLDEIFSLADRVAVMAGGRLSDAGPVEVVTPERLGLMMAGAA